MSIRCQRRQANVVNGSGWTIGAHSVKRVPSGRARIDQHPGAGSQRYSSSVRPSSRRRVRSQTVSDKLFSSLVVCNMTSRLRTVRCTSHSGDVRPGTADGPEVRLIDLVETSAELADSTQDEDVAVACLVSHTRSLATSRRHTRYVTERWFRWRYVGVEWEMTTNSRLGRSGASRTSSIVNPLTASVATISSRPRNLKVESDVTRSPASMNRKL